MELKHTIKLIQVLDSDIEEIEQQIQTAFQVSPVTTIPGISFRGCFHKKNKVNYSYEKR